MYVSIDPGVGWALVSCCGSVYLCMYLWTAKTKIFTKPDLTNPNQTNFDPGVGWAFVGPKMWGWTGPKMRVSGRAEN